MKFDPGKWKFFGLFGKKVVNPMKIDPGKWKYFAAFGELCEIYRHPDNGVGLFRQELEDVYVLHEDGSWRSNQRNRLIDQMHKGWFDEKDDEISEEDAIRLYEKWRKEKEWPGRRWSSLER